jgi:hypothetical protein
VNAVPEHSMPSVSAQLVMPLGGGEQVPTLCPLPMVQTPLQQSPPFVQMSPVCWHHEEGWQVPPAQRPEQQSPAVAQVLPSDLQLPEPGSTAQAPFVHVSVQHWLFDVHFPPFDTQAG